MASLDAVKSYLVITQPFFATFLLQKPVKVTDKVSTAAVDKRGQIYINKAFLEKLSAQELVFILAHEVMHMVCLHALREGGRNHMLWNIAGDYWINSFLKESNVGEMPEGGLYKYGMHSKTTEQIYSELVEHAEKQKGKGKGGKGKNQQSSGSSDSDELTTDNSGDPMGNDLDMSGEPMTPEEKDQIEVETKVTIAAAANAMRMAGRGSGALSRMVDEILTVKTPWYELLARFMEGKTVQEESWKRPNRRFSDVYLPCQAPFPSLGTVVVGIDTSGSIGERELAQFGGHLNSILENCHPEKVIVLYCDSEIAHVDEYSPDDLPVRLEPYGGGGTDMREIMRYIDEHSIDASCCVVLTDGYTPFPDSTPCPTIWAITTDKDAPEEAGETVHIEEE